jgi:hypothetical protein
VITIGIDRSVTAEDHLQALATGRAAVLETLAQMQLGTLDRSGLDEQTYLLVRLAALVATDAAPVSYRVHLGDSGALVLPAAKVLATLVAIAPVDDAPGSVGRTRPPVVRLAHHRPSRQ